MSSAPPFGLLLPSQPILVNPTVISPTQYAFIIPSIPGFKHIAVFLLPGATLPEGTLAGIYVQLPGEGSFRLLGSIGTEKQTALFKVDSNGPSHEIVRNDVGEPMADVNVTPAANGTAAAGEITVGISIEPTAIITAQLESLQGSKPMSTALVTTRQQGSARTKILAQRIIKNAFNFLASFAGTMTAGGEEVVPLKSFQDWWAKFERRIENDPAFLERESD